ncbi:hypothetical protein CROQUDRAFT_98264 [Cronartium quercuum f. sp. fusiforme G11]|uniref:Uncharacterized protein n=1 Tax=Cronartium quercuum f. sp. fusiforme G11 TaxID=708437 RepID=A0A9P6N912_9BASI|nr:hypothetical protein CROQUDRAFT_98264 [Cronartium quercuum f. sp. fusiforme G11]
MHPKPSGSMDVDPQDGPPGPTQKEDVRMPNLDVPGPAPQPQTAQVEGSSSRTSGTLMTSKQRLCTKKRTRVSSVRLDEDIILGTPRSKRITNLFPDYQGNPSMSDAVAKLHHLLEIALPLPKEGGGTATARFREAEMENEEDQATHPTASNGSFAFKVPDALEARRDSIQ